MPILTDGFVDHGDISAHSYERLRAFIPDLYVRYEQNRE